MKLNFLGKVTNVFKNLKISSIPHPCYGNYGGQKRNNEGTPPKDELDALFLKHDNETRKANTYKNPIKRAIAWNTANKNLADGLKRKDLKYFDPDYGELYRKHARRIFWIWSILPVYNQNLIGEQSIA